MDRRLTMRKVAEAVIEERIEELERRATAGPALKRIQEILAAPSPYGLIQEGEGLSDTVAGVHDALVAETRQKAVGRIDGLVGTLTGDVAKVGGDVALRSACVQPLEGLKARVQQDESVAHIAQAESEAVRAFDAAVARVEEYVRKQAVKPATVKKQRVLRRRTSSSPRTSKPRTTWRHSSPPCGRS